MPIITPTKQEHLRRLRTTQQPTIVVEGKDDLLLLHKILDQSNLTTQNILVAGDCLMVQELYTEVAANQTVYPYVKQFFTDLDMRIFTGVPTETDLIFYTKGYSIENDLFADSEDFIDNLFGYANYATDKATVVETVTDWFAFEVEDYMKNPAKITNFKAC
ncbi:MAG: hypothetical protein RLZZ292_2869, partial [Bacteroidota bacterium]